MYRVVAYVFYSAIVLKDMAFLALFDKRQLHVGYLKTSAAGTGRSALFRSTTRGIMDTLGELDNIYSFASGFFRGLRLGVLPFTRLTGAGRILPWFFIAFGGAGARGAMFFRRIF